MRDDLVPLRVQVHGRHRPAGKGNGMIAVIFEVEPKGGKREEYLAMAAALRPVLERIDGFISVERFESLTKPGKLLSLSVFRDETAIDEWRNVMGHRAAQAKGRHEMFANYRIRVTSVIRDYGLNERDEAPADSVEALAG